MGGDNSPIYFTIVCILVLIRQFYYNNELHDMYDTIWCGHFCNFIKIMGNKAFFKERSLPRNLIFDWIRNLLRPIIYPLMYSSAVDWNIFLQLAISSTLFTLLAHFCVDKSFFPKHRLIWAWMNLEFAMMFADSLFMVLNNYESMYNGKLFFFFFCVFLEAN